MSRVIVASTNPVKIKAVARGFEHMFPGEQISVEGIGFESPVSAQPFGDEETLHGAVRRARMARDLVPEADYWVGVEGGVTASRTDMQAFAWIHVQADNAAGQARSASFPLPVKIAELVMDGIELGEADDIVFGRTNSKQANGAVGILTADAVDRQALYEQPVMLALIPFKNPVLFGIG